MVALTSSVCRFLSDIGTSGPGFTWCSRVRFIVRLSITKLVKVLVLPVNSRVSTADVPTQHLDDAIERHSCTRNAPTEATRRLLLHPSKVIDSGCEGAKQWRTD